MKATIAVIAIIGILVPSSAGAWSWGWGSKPSTGASGSGYDPTSKKPYWQQRYENRLQQQWLKPGGENFPTPGRPAATDIDPNKPDLASPNAQKSQNEQFLEQLKKQQEREKLAREAREREQRSLFDRLATAWKGLWKFRILGAGTQSPFTNTSGFGGSVHRSIPTVGISWRTRADLPGRIHRGVNYSWGGEPLAPMY